MWPLIVLLIIIALAALWLFAFWPARLKHRPAFMKADFAHRGLHGSDVPENSMQAFRLAKQNGYGIEFDVRLTSDKVAVIMHDDSLERVCGVKKKVSEITSEQLSEVKLPSGENVPTFAEMLSFIDGKVPLLIELKNTGANYSNLCQSVFEVLDGYKGDYLVESFDPRVLMWIKKHRKKVIRGQLAVYNPAAKPFVLGAVLRKLWMNFLSRPHFIAYQSKYIGKVIESKIILKKGVPYFAWTVKTKEEYDSLKAKGISVIFEDFKP